MAKLEGVKTLDMVGGEITKVEYNGAAYEKVEGSAQAGDLLYCTRTIADTLAGSFYEVITEENGEEGFYDDAGDNCDINYTEHIAFRKESVPTIESVDAKVDALAERVEALEESKTESEEVKPALKAGDYAKTVGSSHNDDIPVGSTVEITETDETSIPYKAEMVGGGNWDWFRADRLVQLTDEEAAEAKRVAKFAKLDRKPGEFKKGDIVRVIKPSSGHDVGIIGEVYEDYTHTTGIGPQVVARLRDGRITELHSPSELIAPVESRVDYDAN